MTNVSITGLGETLNYLEALGAEGDRIGVMALNQAATTLRANYLTKTISQRTGLPRGVVRSAASIRRAAGEDPSASIIFSSAGVPVHLYRYRLQSTGHATRAQIMVDWVTGGQKLAAGFINPRGKAQAPLRTRWKSAGKNPVPRTALAPSVASAFRAIQPEVMTEARYVLEGRVLALLSERGEQ